MALHVMLLLAQLTLVLAMVSSTLTAAPATAAIAKPGCPDRCGNVSIPYPFGMTDEGCNLDEDFLLICNHSTNPPLAYLPDSNIYVTDISLQGQFHILQYIAIDCYDGMNESYSASLNFKKFTLNSENKFTAIGCDTDAYIYYYQGDKMYESGCRSICDSLDNVINESCSGVGCCQTSIPEGVSGIEVELYSYYNYTNVSDSNRCSYAFVSKEGEFNFSKNSLHNLRNTKEFPVVIDWTIGNQTCEEAKKNITSYACKSNTKCYVPNNLTGIGYRCECLEGYQGNPYLSNGCQDVDECDDPSLNNCQKSCVNTVGNFTCSCPKGYHGDGRKDGEGCVADQLFVIKIAFGIALGVIVLFLGSSFLYFGFKRRKFIMQREKFFRQNGGIMLQQQLPKGDGSNNAVKIFTREELEKATNNYDESRIIGRGGYGTVYQGYLNDNRVVAIKKSKRVDQSQIEQFINEVVVLSQINHRNVVRLLGCCLETQVPLLVYEFINNGTLFEHIHNKIKAYALSWDTRLRIAIETAGVLSYLHSTTSTPIIHRDVKSTNILLDSSYTAKVSDFGTSRLVPLDQTQLSTLVQGTLGYLDPEYLHTSQLTEKSDVYSFGVVLVELLTGKKALSFDRPEEERSLAMYFLAALKEDRLFQVLEDHIMCEGNTEQLKEVANLAKRCLNIKGDDRPTMKVVAMELEGLRIMERHPWIKTELNSEETESLLGERSDACGYAGGTTSIGCDSVRQDVILPIDGGR